MGIFKRSSTIKPEPIHEQPKPPVEVISGDPSWMEIAKKEIGETEISGSRDNPRIIEYHKETSLQASDDETAWCSSFANWVMKKAGLPGTNSAAALSWRTYGQRLEEPKYGCIVVFDHGGGRGHVTFFDSFSDGLLRCLGGNQSNQVKYSNYGLSEVVGYRWPILKEEIPKVGDSHPVDYSSHVGEKGWFKEYDEYIKNNLSRELIDCSIESIYGSEPHGDLKIEALCRIFHAIAVAESGLDPTCRYVETGISDPDSVTHMQNVSEGLFQVSQQDQEIYLCEFSWTHDKALAVKDPSKTIFNPIKNIDCTIKILTKLLRRYGSSFEASGSHYWSTLRRGRSGFTEFQKVLKTL